MITAIYWIDYTDHKAVINDNLQKYFESIENISSLLLVFLRIHFYSWLNF